MPFYEAIGRDTHSFEPRELQISARTEREAYHTAANQGVTEIKLRPYTDREMLMLDFKCFLNAEPTSPARTQPRLSPTTQASAIQAAQLKSLLLRHPVLTITTSVLLAIWIDRLAALLIDTF